MRRVLRLAAGLVMTAVELTLVTATVASAQVSPTTLVCVRGPDGKILYCIGEGTAGTPGSSQLEGGREGGESSSDPGGRITYVPLDEDAPDYFRPGYCITHDGIDLLCAVEMGPEGPVPATTPSSYARRFWQGIPLPDPQPQIAPGRAITGMYAYLETRGTTTHTHNEPDTPFGPLTIVATGKYYVDWGDGTRTGPHSAEGEPWPDGRIKHEYIHVGSYDVVVTERWTATWSFGDQSGTLDELRTEGRIEDFPVQQIQAIVFQ